MKFWKAIQYLTLKKGAVVCLDMEDDEYDDFYLLLDQDDDICWLRKEDHAHYDTLQANHYAVKSNWAKYDPSTGKVIEPKENTDKRPF